MNIFTLQPEAVITTRDFPVYNTEVLERYFAIYKNGRVNSLPPVPIMHVDRVTTYFNEPEISVLNEFLTQNPKTEYFLLNGSHRTTAATLTGNGVNGLLLEKVPDIEDLRTTTLKGNAYEHRLKNTIEENIMGLVNHFIGTEAFQTVRQKTDRMVEEGVVPTYMIEYYGDNN